ncbi:5345_t:CDS:10 [Entrophospora sp. SA101]|nr:5345_t:CDS:10 [Entrophospora sp. SA101]
MTRFFSEDYCNSFKKPLLCIHWVSSNPPLSINITNISKQLKSLINSQETTNIDTDKPIEESSFNITDNNITITNQTILQESENIQPIRKPNLFAEEITELEQDIIEKRVALQQQQFAEFEKREFQRKAKFINSKLWFATNEEIKEALEGCKGDEQDSQKESITGLQTGSQKSIQKDDDDKETTLQRHQRTSSKRARGSSSNFSNNRMKGRLALDDALKQVEDYDMNLDKAFEGWSKARVKAFNAIKTNPNTYYYRFNAPGEEQRLGAWTEEEEQVFFNRLEEVGSEGQWGIFSIAIPGRVGYQVKTGRIKDPNYVIDRNGKAHYLFSTRNKQTGETQKTIRTHSKYGNSGGCKTVRGNHSDAQDSPNSRHEKTYVLKSWSSKKRARSYQVNARVDLEVVEQDDENPLPGFIDPITLEEVKRPAISPYGHVMGYDNWVKCLSTGPNKNICPLTKKPLKRRELVILTSDNLNQYRLVNPFVDF